ADPFWHAAESHGVHLLVGEQARTTGAVMAWPPRSVAGARRAGVDAAVIESLRRHELLRGLDHFAAAAIGCLLIKGAALAYTHYAEPHLRPRHDTDLLVPVRDVGRVEGAMDAAGYVRAIENTGDFATSQCHFDRAGAVEGLCAFDIHWRIANPQ